MTALLLRVVCISVFALRSAFAEETTSDDPPAATTMAETVAICVLTLSFAVCISLFGVVVGYFSAKEDALMRRYRREGMRIRAKVDPESILYLRNFSTIPGPRCGCTSDPQGEPPQAADHTDCVAVVVYKSFDREPRAFTKRMRKRVRARVSDLECAAVEWATTPPLSPVHFELLPEERRISFEGPTPSHGHPPDGLELDILQLPKYKASGLPRKQVERACSWGYRLPTIFMVVTIIFFAACCTYVAVDMIAESLLSGRNTNVAVATSAVFSVLLTVEFLLTRAFGEPLVDLALRQEYLEGGDMVGLEYGDSASLSSGDDSFLSP